MIGLLPLFSPHRFHLFVVYSSSCRRFPTQRFIPLLAIHSTRVVLCIPFNCALRNILLAASFRLLPCSMYPSVRRAYMYITCP